jgi:hypothetical protein
VANKRNFNKSQALPTLFFIRDWADESLGYIIASIEQVILLSSVLFKNLLEVMLNFTLGFKVILLMILSDLRVGFQIVNDNTDKSQNLISLWNIESL